MAGYSYEQIDELLKCMQDCIMADRYTIAQNSNRMENSSFCVEYRLSSQRQKELLLRLKTEDFCCAVNNIKAGFEHEILYIFCLKAELTTFEGDSENVEIYIKFNFIECDRYVVVISFHKCNAPLTYCFK